CCTNTFRRNPVVADLCRRCGPCQPHYLVTCRGQTNTGRACDALFWHRRRRLARVHAHSRSSQPLLSFGDLRPVFGGAYRFIAALCQRCHRRVASACNAPKRTTRTPRIAAHRRWSANHGCRRVAIATTRTLSGRKRRLLHALFLLLSRGSEKSRSRTE